jgi:O-antigen/teichoic acid export membrane protein
LLLVYIGWGLPGALAAYAISWIFTDILLINFLNRTYSLKNIIGEAKYNIRSILSFSAPICLTQVISQLRGTFELLFLGMISSLATVGVYSAAVRIQMVGVMLLSAVDMVSKPLISDMYHQGDIIQLDSLYKTLTRWSLLFIIPFFLTILLFAEPVMSIFGEEFASGEVVLRIFSIGTLINASTGICSAMIIMTGHSRISFMNSLIIISVSVVLNLLLIPYLGIIGAAIAATVTIAVISIIRLIQVHRILGLLPYNVELIKPLIASIITISILLIFSRFVPTNENIFILLIQIIVLWVTFFSITIILGLSPEDRIIIDRTKKRLITVISG